VRAGSVRRKKLYYLRNLTGKSARIKEQFAETNKTSVPQPEEKTAEEEPPAK